MGVYGKYLTEGFFNKDKRIKEAEKYYKKKQYKDAISKLKYTHPESDQEIKIIYNICKDYSKELLNNSNDRSEITILLDFLYTKGYIFKDSNYNEDIQRISKDLNSKREKIYKNSTKEISDKEKKDITNTLKNIINKYTKDPKIKQDLDKYNATLICKKFEEDDRSISFIICDDDQQTRINISNIISSIASELEKDIKFNISTGDGDEGCIYINN